MGVPGLFAFLKRRYATIARFIVPKEDGTYDEPDSQGDALYIGESEVPRLNTGRHRRGERQGRGVKQGSRSPRWAYPILATRAERL